MTVFKGQNIMGIISIQEFEDKFKEENEKWDGVQSGKKDINFKIEGYDCYARSQRYKLFLQDNYTCKCCGRKGRYFLAMTGRGSKSQRIHLNLMSEDGILMTKDHILPKKYGGKDIMSNYQTYCAICNTEKGSKIPKSLKPIGYFNSNGEYFSSIGEILNKYDPKIINQSKSTLMKYIGRFYEDAIINGLKWNKLEWTYNKGGEE